MFNKIFISRKEYNKQIDKLYKEIYDLYQKLNRIDKRIDYLEVYADSKTTQHNWDYYTPDACKNCSNHPNNGGSGICHCILGLPKITV